MLTVITIRSVSIGITHGLPCHIPEKSFLPFYLTTILTYNLNKIHWLCMAVIFQGLPTEFNWPPSFLSGSPGLCVFICMYVPVCVYVYF